MISIAAFPIGDEKANSRVAAHIDLISGRACDRATVAGDIKRSSNPPVQGTPECFELGKHRGRLDEIYVVIYPLG